MDFLLRFINFDEIGALLVLIIILVWTGAMMAEQQENTSRRAWRLSAAGFLIYEACAIYTWGADDASDFVLITIRALLAGALSLGVALIVLSTITGVIEILTPKDYMPMRPQLDDHQPTPLEIPAVPPPPPPPLPPPTREELAKAALERYEEKLALIEKAKLHDFERDAAKERAKQQYMRELDEVMK